MVSIECSTKPSSIVVYKVTVVHIYIITVIHHDRTVGTCMVQVKSTLANCYIISPVKTYCTTTITSVRGSTVVVMESTFNNINILIRVIHE